MGSTWGAIAGCCASVSKGGSGQAGRPRASRRAAAGVLRPSPGPLHQPHPYLRAKCRQPRSAAVRRSMSWSVMVSSLARLGEQSTSAGSTSTAMLPTNKAATAAQVAANQCRAQVPHLVSVLLVVVQRLGQGSGAPEQLQGLQLRTSLQGLICGPLPPVGSLAHKRMIFDLILMKLCEQQSQEESGE